jgi:predicted DNA-binding protein (MmcQ/YjbR family)
MPNTKARKAFEALLAYALTFPESSKDYPWGETVVKVRKKKIFIFLGDGTGDFGASVKLPHAKYEALDLPFCTPTGYGLGKAGWVSVRFGPKDDIPIELLKTWTEESYRAVAPKTLLKKLDDGGRAAPPKPKAPKAKAKAKTKTAPARPKAKKKAVKAR